MYIFIYIYIIYILVYSFINISIYICWIHQMHITVVSSIFFSDMYNETIINFVHKKHSSHLLHFQIQEVCRIYDRSGRRASMVSRFEKTLLRVDKNPGFLRPHLFVEKLGGGNSNIFWNFHPEKLGKMNPFWRISFQRGWNHQVERYVFV